MKLYRSILFIASLFALASCGPKDEVNTGESIQKFSINEGEYMSNSYKLKNSIFKFEGSGDNLVITLSTYEDLASYVNGGTPTSKTLDYEYKLLDQPTAHGNTAIVATDEDKTYTFYYNPFLDTQLIFEYAKGLGRFSTYLVELKDVVDFTSAYNIPSGKYDIDGWAYLYNSKTNKQLDGRFSIRVNVDPYHHISSYYSKGGPSSPITSYVELNSFCAKGIYNDQEPLLLKEYNATTKSFKIETEREAFSVYAKAPIEVFYFEAY